MNTNQVSSILTFIFGKEFSGVFAADKLPKTPSEVQRPSFFVANTHESKLPGEHWVAFTFLRWELMNIFILFTYLLGRNILMNF